MVGSTAKRRSASYFREAHDRPVERACALAGLSRSSWYYRPRRGARDAEVARALRQLAAEHPARGFDNYYARLRAAGHTWSRSRVLRIYRMLGLKHRPRRKRHITPTEDRRPMAELSRRDEVWACDFLTDALADGRSVRVIAVMDEYSRECLAVEASVSYPSTRVCRLLDGVAEVRGTHPACLRTDNGPEFVAGALAAWSEGHEVHHHRIAPGRPMDDGRVERLNRTLREDVLDYWSFGSLGELNEGLVAWRGRYNATHPHTALGGQAPEAYGRAATDVRDGAAAPSRTSATQERLPSLSNSGLS